MNIKFQRYKTWKSIKNELGIFEFYILPTIVVYRDEVYLADEYPTQIKVAWLFWELCIYLKK